MESAPEEGNSEVLKNDEQQPDPESSSKNSKPDEEITSTDAVSSKENKIKSSSKSSITNKESKDQASIGEISKTLSKTSVDKKELLKEDQANEEKTKTSSKSSLNKKEPEEDENRPKTSSKLSLSKKEAKEDENMPKTSSKGSVGKEEATKDKEPEDKKKSSMASKSSVTGNKEQSVTFVTETKTEETTSPETTTNEVKKSTDLGADELEELFNIESVVSERTLVAAGVEKPKVEKVLTQEEKDALELEKHIDKADKKIAEFPMNDKEIAEKVAQAAAEIQGEVYEIPDEKASNSSILFGSSSIMDSEAPEVDEKNMTEEEKQEKQIEQMKELVKSFLPIPKIRIKKKKFVGEGESGEEGERSEKPFDESSTEEVTPEEIDRDPFYEQYYKLVPILATTQFRNMLLIRKLTAYYKKKKMEHVLKTSEEDFDTIQKYRKRLDALNELLDINKNQRTTFTEELKELRKNRNGKKVQVENLCKSLLDKEKNIGFGLISSKTGSPLPDKYVESLIKRQKAQINLMRDLRLKYILLKNKIAKKQRRLKELDTIGEGYPLIDYEELKMEHRSYMDKIEERDDELSKLRSKVKDAIQTLAHVKEKSAAINSNLVQLQLQSNRLIASNNYIRENLNELKQKREYYRKMTNKVHMDCGLLTYPDLLRDMENAIEEQKMKAEELKKLKEDNETKARQIRAIRKNIEQSVGEKAKKLERAKIKKRRKSIEAPARRPTIFQPKLSEDFVKSMERLSMGSTDNNSNQENNNNNNHNNHN